MGFVSARYVNAHLISDEHATRIWRAYDKSTGRDVVIKCPKKNGGTQTLVEVQLLPLLCHRNIIRIVDAFVTRYGAACVFPHALCDLFSVVERTPLTEAQVREVAKALFSALAYIHGMGVIHRDVKMENILLLGKEIVMENVILADFGLACQGAVMRDRGAGSIHYVAPEIWRREEYWSAIDVWSAGMTLLVCLSGRFPLPTDPDEIRCEVAAGLPHLMRSGCLCGVSSAARGFVRWLLNPNPFNRPTAEEAMGHDWLLGVRDGAVGMRKVREVLQSEDTVKVH